MRIMSNVDFNPSSVESCAEYRMQMLKIKHKDGTFLDLEVSTCGMAQKENLTRRRN